MTKSWQGTTHKTASTSALLIMCLCFCVKSVAATLPAPTDAFIYGLKESIVKVNVTTKSGGHGFGTGVAVTKDHVVTNCHVVQTANGISISKWGEEFAPVSMQADWKHDLCVLKFEWANLKPVPILEGSSLNYEQSVISISMPTDSPAPYVALSTIKAIYPMDEAEVIRTEAAFSIGASGSPVFDYDGHLIAISTFKSPGKNAYFYNMSAKWIQAILQSPAAKLNSVHDLPFWDAPDTARPFFMQVVLPYQNKRWAELQTVATNWTKAEPNNAEAWYYSGAATSGLGNNNVAKSAYEKALSLHANHPASLKALAILAHSQGDVKEEARLRGLLESVDSALIASLDEAISAAALEKSAIKN